MRLFRDRRGGVAIMAGLLALPLLGMVGLAIDFGAATAVKAQLDLAADAAALLATTAASNAYLAGAADPIAPAQATATQRFTAQAGRQVGVSISAVTVTVHQSGTQFSADVDYQGAVKTTLGQLFGLLTMGVAGHASSSLSINPYIDISVLMDVSSSMSIAANPDAIAAMQNLTQATDLHAPSNAAHDSCAFACHWTATGDDYYALALRNNIPLRIDTLRGAVGNLVSSIAALNTHAAFRLGLYTFAQDFTQIYPMSDQVADATAVLPQIVPHLNNCTNNCPDTQFAGSLASFGSIAGISGNGASPQTSQKFLFIVSDGVVDDQSTGRRVIAPVSRASCDAIKAQGITILTLYTPYLPLPSNSFYNQFVAPIQDQVGPALQACATAPTMFFQAANAGDIDTQLKLMLASVIKTSGYLTQ